MPKRSDQTFVDLLAQAASLDKPPPPGTRLEGARSLPLDRVDPNPQQSRQVFDADGLEELAASIREHGVLEPILVRPAAEGRYQVIAGERRTRAARLAGISAIPALIRELTDAEAAYVTAVENLQREDLDIEDEARHLQTLIDLTGLSGRALAEKLGKGRNYINYRLSLLRHPDLLQSIRDGIMTQREALGTASYRDSLPSEPLPAGAQPDETHANLAYGVPLRETDSINGGSAPSPPPPLRLVERAELDQDTPARGPARIDTPYRARALSAAITTLLRMDWRGVPAGERAAVLGQLDLLEQEIAAAKAALQPAKEDTHG